MIQILVITFVLISNVLKELYDMKEEKKILINKSNKTIYKTILSYCLKCRKKYRKYKSKSTAD